MAERLEFTKNADGSIRFLGGHWPEEVEISVELVNAADGKVVDLSPDKNEICFSAVNGRALYRMEPERGGARPARLLGCAGPHL